MNISIEYNPIMNVCCARLTGTISGRTSVQRMLHEFLPVAAQHECSLFLFDFRDVRITSGTFETFWTGEDLSGLGFDRLNKAALVYSQDESEHRFLETVARNRGYFIRIFNDMNQAMSWLTGDESSNQSLQGTP